MTENNTEKKNRAVLVGLSSRALAPEENADEASMEELSALLETAGGECVGVVTQSKDSPDPRTFIGEGKVAEVKELAHAMDADMVIFDNGLSPSQQRVLSEDLGVSVLDRSALILDIFAQRARTRRTPFSSSSSLEILRRMCRRSLSSWVSPGPRVPMAPSCRS